MLNEHKIVIALLKDRVDLLRDECMSVTIDEWVLERLPFCNSTNVILYAIEIGSINCLKYLCQRYKYTICDDIPFSMLKAASSHGSLEVLHYLIEEYKYVIHIFQAHTLYFHMIARRDNVEAFNLWHNAFLDNSPIDLRVETWQLFIYAVIRAQKWELLKRLCDLQIDINIEIDFVSMTALHVLCAHGNLEIFEYVYQKFKNSFTLESLRATDIDDTSGLLWVAVAKGQIDICRYLLLQQNNKEIK